MPKSLTLTLRLNMESVLGCGDMLQQQGIDVSTQPVSTTVRTVIEAVVELMQRKGQLPSYVADPEHLDKVYKDMFNVQLGSPDQDLDGLGELLKSRAAGRDEIDDIAAEVERRLGPGGPANIMRDTAEAETPDPPPRGFNIFDLFHKDADKLIAESPKDKWIIFLQDKECDPVLRRAVLVAYSSLEPTEWGTATADALIKDLLSSHRDGK